MPQCQNCQSTIEDQQNFCPQCGAAISERSLLLVRKLLFEPVLDSDFERESEVVKATVSEHRERVASMVKCAGALSFLSGTIYRAYSSLKAMREEEEAWEADIEEMSLKYMDSALFRLLLQLKTTKTLSSSQLAIDGVQIWKEEQICIQLATFLKCSADSLEGKGAELYGGEPSHLLEKAWESLTAGSEQLTKINPSTSL